LAFHMAGAGYTKMESDQLQTCSMVSLASLASLVSLASLLSLASLAPLASLAFEKSKDWMLKKEE